MAKRGRKTLFRDEIIKESESMAGFGLTESQISNVFHISHSTLIRWKRNKPEFDEALKRGAYVSNNTVVKSLYKRAIGFQYEEVHKAPEETVEYKDGQRVSLTKNYDKLVIAKVITKHIVPDVTAQIFWLKNRLPNEWRDRKEVEHTVELTITNKLVSARLRLLDVINSN